MRTNAKEFLTDSKKHVESGRKLLILCYMPYMFYEILLADNVNDLRLFISYSSMNDMITCRVMAITKSLFIGF